MDVAALDIAIITLLLIISAVGIATRSLRFPYPIALVLAGLLIGMFTHGPFPLLHDLPLGKLQLTPHLILVLFLPALLFEATLHIEATTLRKTLLPIAVLAIPGVLLTAGIVGALVHWAIGVAWPSALLFGVIVSATDPIAVLAIFKRLGAPHEFELIVEGESLFNDGTAVVLARILLAVALAGTFDPVHGLLDFALVVGGGLLVGLISGGLCSRLTAQIDDHLIEITLTTILTYGTFVIAEALGVVAQDRRRRGYMVRRAQLLMLRAGWRELQHLEEDAVVSPRVYVQLDPRYRSAEERVNSELESSTATKPSSSRPSWLRCAPICCASSG
jgi:CPA1 family monovalent cation:H+ antiporter